MLENQITVVREFFDAALNSYSYNILQNTYMWFGIAWGIPIPFISSFYEIKIAGQPELLEAINHLATTPIQWFFLALPLIFGLLFGILGTIRKQKDNQVNLLVQQLRDLSNIDSLTGLNNRRNFTNCYLGEKARIERSGHPMSILLIDLDFFKRINDELGHNAGDNVLRVVGTYLKDHSRPYDVPARWGGEEFAVLLPRTDEQQALAIAERLRKDLPSMLTSTIAIEVTASIGISQHYTNDTLETFTERADKALYQAKNKGRNRCAVWSSLTPIE